MSKTRQHQSKVLEIRMVVTFMVALSGSGHEEGLKGVGNVVLVDLGGGYMGVFT